MYLLAHIFMKRGIVSTISFSRSLQYIFLKICFTERCAYVHIICPNPAQGDLAGSDQHNQLCSNRMRNINNAAHRVVRGEYYNGYYVAG